MRLQTRLALLITVPMIVSLLLFGFLGTQNHLHTLRQGQITQGEQLAQRYAALLELSVIAADQATIEDYSQRLFHELKVVEVQVFDRKGQRLSYHRRAEGLKDALRVSADIIQNTLDIGFSEFDDEAERYYAQTSQVIGVVSIGLSSADLSRDQQQAVFLALLVTGFGMLLAALMGYILSRYISRPVLRLRQQVLRIQEGDLTARFDTFSDGELGELERGVEQMANSLRHSMQGMQTAIDNATEDLTLTVAELQEKNTQLHQARAEAEQLSKDKGRFLATMSHELRTPLNAILGFSRQLSGSDPTQRENLKIIHHSCQQLELLMDDVLTFSKLDGGSLELHIEQLSISVLARDLLSMLNTQVDTQSVTLQLEVDCDVPEFAKTDRLRLSQILSNLLSNALKNTINGEVILKISCCQQQRALRFDVIDTGTGIAEHELNSLFEPFRQLQQQPTSGVGLGLSIVRSLTEIMGGDIKVASTLGKGSCFTLILPVEMSNDQEKKSNEGIHDSCTNKEMTPQLPWRVLVVEDNSYNQKLFKQLLQARNAEVDVVTDASQIIDSTTLNCYQLILMDQHMPSMNGIDASEYIRQRVDISELPPIVLVTADVLSDYEVSLRQGLVDAVLYKPVHEEKLDQLLLSFIPAEFYQQPTQEAAIDTSAIGSDLSLEIQRLMTEMRRSLHDREYEDVADWLHQLQGIAGYHKLLNFQILVESLSELLTLKEYEEVLRCLAEFEPNEIAKC
jgi:two-component system sensor histidine kinase BarA